MKTLIVLAAVGAAADASAAFVGPDWRGSAESTYQQWDNPASSLFGNYPGPYAPDSVSDNVNGEASLSVSGHIPTSTGNIYDPSAPWDIDVTIPDFGLGGGYDTEVWVQILIVDFGNDLDPASVMVNGQSATLVSGTVETDEYLFKATVPGNAGQTLVSFSAAEVSTSLDRLAIDTHAVVALLAGDTDGDGDIDDFDLLAAIAGFTGSLDPGAGSATSANGDTDADADVDDFDLLTMISGFTGSLSAPAASVPEPGVAGLLGLGAIGLLRRRR